MLGSTDETENVTEVLEKLARVLAGLKRALEPEPPRPRLALVKEGQPITDRLDLASKSVRRPSRAGKRSG